MARPDDSRIIADAASLLRDEEDANTRPSMGNTPAPTPEVSEAVESYDLASSATREPAPKPTPPVAPKAPKRPQPESVVEKGSEAPAPSTVDPPWSRMAEWGPALVRITVALIAAVGLFWFLLSAGMTSIAFVTFLAIGALCVLLSYPIAITLERPVRMTPEHALADFYAALSHHLPHHRRMWLLLSDAGRRSSHYKTFPEFRAYYVRRLGEIKGSGKRWTPVKVVIDEFTAEKSAGHDAVAASYRVSISLRDDPRGATLYSNLIRTTLSRGPDRMWYLDDGTLPPSR